MTDIVKASRQDEDAVKTLLNASDLPVEDLTPAHMDNFFLLYDNDRLIGCVGLEIYGENALMRSLAVESSYRGQGLGIRLLAAAESGAASNSVRNLYLLTTTAEGFFAAHGYQMIERSKAPQDIQQTCEYQSLCPSSAASMFKRLIV